MDATLFNEIVKIRRHINAHPELGFEEYETAKLVAEYLRNLGIEVVKNVAKTGVVGLIRGNGRGKNLLLRADMDALPIGHCCGHDVHTAILLGVANVLSREELEGDIKLVFQPAEENLGGAQPMIAEGVLENPHIDGAAAYHISDLPLGMLGVKTGIITASPDFFVITINGKGGHGAHPAECVNPLEIAARITGRIHQLSFDSPFVATVCSINGGDSENIIPQKCIMKGTARTFDSAIRLAVYEAINEICSLESEKLCGEADLDYRFRYPPIINDKSMVKLFVKSAKTVIPAENIIAADKPDMIGDDFAYFAETVPSCYIKLGGAKTVLHAPDFHVDENCIKYGVDIMCEFARSFTRGDKV
jgi:amidohydrolase